MNTLSIISAAAFPVITIIFFALLIKAFRRSIGSTTWPEDRKKNYLYRLTLSLVLWAIAVSALSLSGFTQRFDLFPLNVGPMLMVPLISVLIFVFSRSLKEILIHADLKTLTQLQVFRVLVELVLWALFLEGKLPQQMTFEGYNMDVLSGLTSLVAARFFLQSKGWMIAWNIFGMALLINIVTIAILSMPTFLQVFKNEPANTIVAYFPYVFLPTFLVPLAYTLHFLSLKKLLMKS